MCSLTVGSLLVFICGKLVEEVLAMNGLLLFASSLLVDMALAGHCLEAMMLVLLQGVDCPLPILVGAFRTGASLMKNGPPGWFQRQQPDSLLAFAKAAI